MSNHITQPFNFLDKNNYNVKGAENPDPLNTSKSREIARHKLTRLSKELFCTIFPNSKFSLLTIISFMRSLNQILKSEAKI